MKQNKSNFNSVEKALKILLTFHAQQSSWGVRELSVHLGFSPATVQRILQTLKTHAFVDQNPETKHYHLGNVFFYFLDVLQSTHKITQSALPFMKKLLSATQETVHLNVIDGMERICIDSIESPQYLKASMPIGNRSPLYAGATPKCLLAFSPKNFIDNYVKQVKFTPLTENTITNIKIFRSEIAAIRKRGYAKSLGERTPGIGSISAPVVNHRGMILAAISLAIPELRFKNNNHRNLCLKKLLNVTKKFSKTMGYISK
jgi:IclR family transcriptional regulator, KDG regulon repressor